MANPISQPTKISRPIDRSANKKRPIFTTTSGFYIRSGIAIAYIFMYHLFVYLYTGMSSAVSE